MRLKTKRQIKKAGAVIVILVIGVFAGAALFGDSGTSQGENRTFVQELQESISGATSTVTSTYEPYSVKVISVQDDMLYQVDWMGREYNEVSGTDVHIVITNNADEVLNTELINVGIVYNDGTQKEALKYYQSSLLGVSYSSVTEYINLYPSAQKECHIAFEKIDRDKNPKLSLRFVDGRFTPDAGYTNKVIDLSPYL